MRTDAPGPIGSTRCQMPGISPRVTTSATSKSRFSTAATMTTCQSRREIAAEIAPLQEAGRAAEGDLTFFRHRAIRGVHDRE